MNTDGYSDKCVLSTTLTSFTPNRACSECCEFSIRFCERLDQLKSETCYFHWALLLNSVRLKKTQPKETLTGINNCQIFTIQRINVANYVENKYVIHDSAKTEADHCSVNCFFFFFHLENQFLAFLKCLIILVIISSAARKCFTWWGKHWVNSINQKPISESFCALHH